MAATPIQIFELAHQRAEDFLGLTTKGRKADDDLRAAVVFSVAAVDAYFHTKILKHFREKRTKSGNFTLPIAAQELIREVVALELTKSEYRDLPKKKQELVNYACVSSNPSLLSYLEEALKRKSFQSTEDMSSAMRIMGQTPQEIWGRFDSSTKVKAKKLSEKRTAGRPKKNKRGRKIDAKKQMGKLFSRRHLIVHDADILVRGNKSGKPRPINSTYVRKWINSSKDAIKRIDNLIT